MTIHGRGFHMRRAVFSKSDPMAGAIGYWVVSDQISTPIPQIPNRKAATSKSNNLLFSVPSDDSVWGKVNTTFTGYVAGPDGSSLNGIRLVGTTGGWQCYRPMGNAAGSVTTAMWVKSNTGVTQTLQLGTLNSGLSTISATTTWARVAVTKSCTAGEYYKIASNDGVTANDIIIAFVDAYAGSLDLQESPAGHLMLGIGPGSHVPTLNSGYMTLNSSSQAAANFPVQTYAGMTAIAVARKTSAGTGVYPIINSGKNSSDFAPTFEWSGIPSANGNRSIDNGVVGPFEPNGKGWFFQASGCDATGGHVWFDQGGINGTSTGFSPFTTTGFVFGNYNGNYDVHDISAYALFPSLLTNSQILTVYNKMVADVSANITMASIKLVFALGDSLTAGFGTTNGGYPKRGASSITGTPPVINYGVNGYKLSDLNTKVLPYLSGRPDGKTIFTIYIGTNDASPSYTGTLGNGLSGWLADYAATLDALRKTGAKVAIGTFASGTTIADADRVTLNTELRLWTTSGSTVPGQHCDAIMDFAADANLGANGANLNGTYYQGDHLHWTDTGQLEASGLWVSAVNSII
jgi:lysophospholipase L1-like esterase